MKKLYLLFAFAFFATAMSAQVTGTKTIGVDYPTIAAAVTALNTTGVGAGGAIINVPAGYTETAPSGGYVLGTTLLNASLSAANTLKITKSGAGTNPLITAFTGGTSTTSDGIFKIAGADYVTIDGIDLKENAANTVAALMEWGYALVNLNAAAPFDGVQFLTIQNCSVTLNKTNPNGSFAFYGANNIATATTALAITVAADVHSNNKFYANTITNADFGFFFGNLSATVPVAALFGQNNDIGGASAATGNNISNIGGLAAFNVFAIYMSYQNGGNVSNNTATGVTGISGTQLTIGVYFFGATANTTANNNNITLAGTAATGNVAGIYSANTGNLTATGNTITFNDAAGSATHYGIYSASVGTVNISTNTFKATNSGATTGTYYFVYHASTAAGGSTLSGNIFNNISLSTTAAAYLIYASNSTPNVTASNNSITGTFTKTGAGGTFYGYYNFGSPASGTATITNNNFSNITLTGATAFYGIYQATLTSQIENVNTNTISNITTGAAAGVGIYHSYGAAGSTANGNTVSNLTTAGANSGIQIGNTTPLGISVLINNVNNITGGGASVVTGILYTNGTAGNISGNLISGISASNAGATVNGLTIAGAATSLTVANNLIGDLRAPLSTNAADAIRGINITAVTANSPINLYHNTVNINAVSTGANFSTSALFATTSATATSASLTLTNNILINTSVPMGTGYTSAYRRSSATLTNYNAASNNNLYYAGGGCTNNAIYYNGTTGYNTIPGYQAVVTPRDAGSVTELSTPFIATTGAGSTFLHLSATTPTLAEAGGIPVASVTTDFDGQPRSATTPDIGGDEFSGIRPAACAGTPTSGAITGTGNVCTGFGTTLTLTGYSNAAGITLQWQSANAIGGPYGNIACATGPTYNTGVIPTGTTVYYQVVVTCSNGGGNATTVPFAVTSNPIPTVAVTPAAPSICAGGTGVSLTASGASTYTWLPTAGLTPATGAVVNANPTLTTTYTVTGTSAAGCSSTASSVVTVNNPPAAPVVSPTSASICLGGIQQLNASSGGPATLLSENFNSLAVGALPAGWVQSIPAGSTCSWGGFAANNAGGVANEMRLNLLPAGVTETGTYALVPPILNASGITALSLSFKSMMNHYSSTYPYSINVETSPDNVTWTNRYIVNVTATIPAATVTVDLSAMNNTSFYVRFAMKDQVFGAFYWYIDDVVITGTASGGVVWSPTPTLYTNAAATTPYTGTVIGTVYAKPTVTTTYTATATGAGGCTSSTNVTVSINTAPTFSTQPTNQTVCAGNTATFTSAATAPAGGVTYQWYVSTNGGGTFNPMGGETNATLVLAGTTTAQSGNQYQVTATDGCGNTLSNIATLTVTAPANATISYPSSPYCAGTGIINVTRVGTAGGTYSSTAGLSLNAATGAVNLALTTAGTYTVTYTVAAAGGCPSFSTTASITVNINSTAPTGATATNANICGTGGVTDLSVVGGALAPGAQWKWYAGSCGGSLIGTGATLTGIQVFNTTTFYVRAEGICNNTACASVTINVNPVPAVVLTAAYGSAINPFSQSVLLATVSPAGNYTYVFRKDGVILTNATNPLIQLTPDSVGVYTVTVTNTATGCTATSNTVVITAAPSNFIFITPNPNKGQFDVRYYAAASEFGAARSVNVYDSKGARVAGRTMTVTSAYTIVHFDLTQYAGGSFTVVVADAGGKRLATGQIMVLP